MTKYVQATDKFGTTGFNRLKMFAKAQFSAFAGGMFDYAIMLLLTEYAGIHYTISIAAACMFGAAVNFSLNKRWAFLRKNVKYRFSFSQQLLRFIFVLVSSIALKTAGTYIFVTLANVDYRICRVIVDIIVSLCYNYVLQRYWIFK
ncbi:MAG: GtrA family protein [Prevotellaceae bacterium]|jgi:putative flippase GtrA|nr:GtrA family protein [Prevotellaceae bacterium]